MECYLDNSATTQVSEGAVEVMNKIYREDYGNTSSLHKKGFDAEKYIRSAKENFASLLKCSKNEIYFTSGGSESNNTAIFGTALHYGSRGHHMITTAVEHAAVAAPMKFLESRGWDIDYLSVDSEGRISPRELERLLRDDTILVSIMHVNNEIGTIEPIEETAGIVHEKCPDCLFHVDDIQGFGKIPLYPKKQHIDLLSASSHKLHGPKGAGLLYISERAHISPIILGGGHQNGMRSGTENVPGVAGFSYAASEIYKNIDENYNRIESLRSDFINKISNLGDISVNGSSAHHSPYILSLTIKGVRAEVLLHALEEKEIYVSAGSACSSNHPSVSAVLKAIKVPDYALDSTIRLSFSPATSAEELDKTAAALHSIVPMLRKFTRK